MQKMAEIVRSSWNEMKKVRSLTAAAMLMAVSVVLGYFTIIAGPYLQIGFSTIVDQFVCFLFGPVLGAFYGASLDLIKYVVRPTGSFFFGFTFNAILGGILYGCFYYRRALTFKRVLAANLTVNLICNVILTTFWLSLMSGKAMAVLLPVRLVKNLVMWPLNSMLFYLIAEKCEAHGLVKSFRDPRTN